MLQHQLAFLHRRARQEFVEVAQVRLRPPTHLPQRRAQGFFGGSLIARGIIPREVRTRRKYKPARGQPKIDRLMLALAQCDGCRTQHQRFQKRGILPGLVAFIRQRAVDSTAGSRALRGQVAIPRRTVRSPAAWRPSNLGTTGGSVVCNVVQRIPGHGAALHRGRLSRRKADPDFPRSAAIDRLFGAPLNLRVVGSNSLIDREGRWLRGDCVATSSRPWP
jgi:hypothetical protein